MALTFESVSCRGGAPATGRVYALNTPVALPLTSSSRPSGENHPPDQVVVARNCSMVYRGTAAGTGAAGVAAAATGAAGPAEAAATVPESAISVASVARPERPASAVRAAKRRRLSLAVIFDMDPVLLCVGSVARLGRARWYRPGPL